MPAKRMPCGPSPIMGILSRLGNKRAVITGADSRIGRAVAIAFAREGADILIAYLDEA
jgi:NAD(P)-dependent dehydrogenase (short-subunit alcohol dehydrogenase family)